MLLCLGLNHKTAPLAVRETLSFGDEEVAASLASARLRLSAPERGGVSELMILSTCNRTEAYCVAPEPERARAALTEFLCERKGVAAARLEPHLYRYQGAEAARHLFRVVCGIDSMVLGETQIVGQFKRAARLAREGGALGTTLHHLFEQAFATAKTVRSQTAIGASSVSFAAAAVRLATRLFGPLSGESVLYIGAGEMIELCAAHFGAQRPRRVAVANRSPERGQALAARYGGEALPLAGLPDYIADFDVIISCTAAALPIIGLGLMERAVRKRRHRPVCLIDLAVPRDVEPEVSRLDDVYVYSLDELGAVIESGRESRRAAAVAAEGLISLAVDRFARWLDTRAAIPAICALRDRAELIRGQELTRARRQLAAGRDPDAVLAALSRSLTNKLTHGPTTLLRDARGLSAAERRAVDAALARFYRPRGR